MNMGGFLGERIGPYRKKLVMTDQQLGSLHSKMTMAKIAVREAMDSDASDFEVKQKLVRYTNLLVEYKRALQDVKAN